MSKVELKVDDVTVYTSGATTPGPTPPGPVVPGPVVPPPAPPTVPGTLTRYFSAPSNHAKIIFLTDAENMALQVAGRADANTMANLVQWFYYNGIKGMSKNALPGGGFQYTYPVNIGEQWVVKIDTGLADADCPVQPVPRAP